MIDSEYPFAVIRILRSMLRPVRVLKTFATIVRQGKQADLLFVHGLALEAVIANLLLRKPLVQKIVGDLAWERACTQGIVQDDIDTFQQKRYGLKIELIKKLRSFWVKNSDNIITPSIYLKKIVCCWGVPEDKITVIYNAVDTAHLAPDTRADCASHTHRMTRCEKQLFLPAGLFPGKVLLHSSTSWNSSRKHSCR